MTDPASIVKTKIKELMTSLHAVELEAASIYNTYWKSDAQSLLSAVTPDSTAVTTATCATKITKTEFTNGIIFCEALNNFFGNAAVAQSDYTQHCVNIQYGNDATSSKLSEAVEALGTRLFNLCTTCLTEYDKCVNVLSLWTVNELADINAVLDAQTFFPGFDATKDVVNSGITVVEQFKKLMNNEVVSTGNYASSVSKWDSIAV